MPAWLSLENLRRATLAALILALLLPSFAVAVWQGSGIILLFPVLVAGFALMLIEFARTRVWHWRTHHWLWLGLALVATVLIVRAGSAPAHSFVEPPLGKMLKQLVYLYTGVAVGLLAPYLIRSFRDLRWAVTLLQLGAWVALVYALAESAGLLGWFAGFGALDRFVRNNPSFFMSPARFLFNGMLPRLQAFAPEPSFLALLLSVPLGLVLARLVNRAAHKTRRDYMLAGGLVLLYALTFSRLAIIILLGMLAVLALMTRRWIFSWRWLPGLVGAGALIVFSFVSSSFGRIGDAPLPLGVDNSIYTRVVSQLVAFQVWLANPFGIGWGMFAYYFPQSVQPYLHPHALELQAMALDNPRAWVPIHNTFLRVGVELGVEGLILYLGMIGSAVRTAWHAIKTAPSTETYVAQASLATLVGVLAASMVADLAGFGMFWFVIAFSSLTGLGHNVEAEI
jgi:hypothetical protein